MRLLQLDSSITGANSVSRLLTAEIVDAQRAKHPGIEVTYRDLAATPLMHLSPAHMAAFQGAQVTDENLGRDLALGAEVMDELFAADVIVIGAPLYNFTIPTQLKAWIDRVAVAGKTFRYPEKGPLGLLPPGKTVFIASTAGGVYSGASPAKAMEHGESYLLAVLHLIGLDDVTVVRAEGLNMGPEPRARAIENARLVIAGVEPMKKAA